MCAQSRTHKSRTHKCISTHTTTTNHSAGLFKSKAHSIQCSEPPHIPSCSGNGHQQLKRRKKKEIKLQLWHFQHQPPSKIRSQSSGQEWKCTAHWTRWLGNCLQFTDCNHGTQPPRSVGDMSTIIHCMNLHNLPCKPVQKAVSKYTLQQCTHVLQHTLHNSVHMYRNIHSTTVYTCTAAYTLQQCTLVYQHTLYSSVHMYSNRLQEEMAVLNITKSHLCQADLHVFTYFV